MHNWPEVIREILAGCDYTLDDTGKLGSFQIDIQWTF